MTLPKDQAAAAAAAADARELAARAQDLAAAIRTYRHSLNAAAWEPIRQAGFQCDTAADYAQQAAAELLASAARLDRIAAAAAPGTCSIPWGACPVHGASLAAGGGRSWCQAPGCGRRWDYDRIGLPCTEPARWLVTGARGDGRVMCDGHAADARRRLEGAHVTLLHGGGR